MAVTRVDRIWDGALSPVTVTKGGVTAAIGLSRTDWQAPMQVVCARLQAALSTAIPSPGTWSCTVLSDHRIAIGSTGAPFDVTFAPGFARFLGFASSTYTFNLLVESDATPEYYRSDCFVSYGLPVQFWHRSNRALHSVIWGGAWYALDVSVTEPNPATPVWSPSRCTFAVSGTPGTTTPWSPAARGGYLVLRPTQEETTTEWFDNETGDWTKGNLRCVVITAGSDLC